MEHKQIEFFDLSLYETCQIERTVIYDPTWDSDLYSDEQSTCKSVGEQVQIDTKKTAHQQERGFTQWIEKYWVERGSNKYWYFRYTWMEGRKLRRRYIGSTNSTRARNLKVIVEEAILDQMQPNEIIRLIDEF